MGSFLAGAAADRISGAGEGACFSGLNNTDDGLRWDIQIALTRNINTRLEDKWDRKNIGGWIYFPPYPGNIKRRDG